MKALLSALVLAMVLFRGLPAQAGTQAACIVTGLEGKCMVIRNGFLPLETGRFKKLIPGDELSLPADSIVRLNFFSVNKTEEWRGPVTLTVQQTGARGVNPTSQSVTPITHELPLPDTSIKDSPLLTEQTELVSAQINVRSPGDRLKDAPLDAAGKKHLAAVESEFKRLQQILPPGDVTPSLYLLAQLEKLGQKARMSRILKELLNSDDSNENLAAMLISLHAR